jgi:ABC-2 type transport system permease protein/lipopolysaccharide transport system permease protein
MNNDHTHKPQNPGRAIFNERKIWTHLGWRDLRSRYARTLIGPWWSVANLITVVFGSSLAVGLISGNSALSQAPRMVISFSLWLLINAMLNEAVEMFEAEKSLLLNTQISEATLVVRLLWRNYLVFLHSFVVVVITFIIVREPLSFRLLALFPISLVVCLGALFPIYVFARSIFVLRDLKVVLPSVIQLVFFLTPILWTPPESGPMHTIFIFNPAGWVIEFTRQLILDNIFNGYLLLKVSIFAVVSLFCMSLSAKSMGSIRKRL